MRILQITVAWFVIILTFSLNISVLGQVPVYRTTNFFTPAHADEGGDGPGGGSSDSSSDSSGGGGGGDAGVGNDGAMGGPSGEGGGGVGGDTGVGNDGAMGGPSGEGPGDQGVGLGGSPDDTDTGPDTTQSPETTQEQTQETPEEQKEQVTEVQTQEPKSFSLLDFLANLFGVVVSVVVSGPVGAVVGAIATNVSQVALGIQTNVEKAADLVSSVFSQSPEAPASPTDVTGAFSGGGGEFGGLTQTNTHDVTDEGLSGVDTGTPNSFFGTLNALFGDVQTPSSPVAPNLGSFTSPSSPSGPTPSGGSSSGSAYPSVTAPPPSVTFNLDTNFSTLTRTLYWAVTGATYCDGFNFNTGGKLSGSVPIAQSADLVVAISCGGPGGLVDKALQIRPLDASAASLSPITVETTSGNFQVTWNAPSDVCVITNTEGFSYRITSRSGSIDAGPAKSGVQFSITCEN